LQLDFPLLLCPPDEKLETETRVASGDEIFATLPVETEKEGYPWRMENFALFGFFLLRRLDRRNRSQIIYMHGSFLSQDIFLF